MDRRSALYRDDEEDEDREILDPRDDANGHAVDEDEEDDEEDEDEDE